MYRKSCTMYHNTTHYTYNMLYFNQLLCGTTYITTCVQLYLVQLYFNSPPPIQQKNPPLTNHEKRKKEICLNYHTDIPLFFLCNPMQNSIFIMSFTKDKPSIIYSGTSHIYKVSIFSALYSFRKYKHLF